jgi:hypothetical protein
LKRALARKVVKSTARHTVHGTASKLSREPIRAAALLTVGGVAGGLAGWRLGRGGGSGENVFSSPKEG